MEILEPIWAGLAAIAHRVDLWSAFSGLGGPARAPSASWDEWRAAGLTEDQTRAVLRAPGWGLPGIRAGGPGWPSALDGLPKGPVALCAEGNLAVLARPMVAIVGARACTAYGRVQARRIAEAVAAAGGVVVSGLAMGIDTAAHEAAKGATVAVIGQGMRAGMPAWQARLRERLLDAGGLVLSELPPELPGASWTYPFRNRIIAGLAAATVVVEAGDRSGALITARYALDYQRERLAVPGPVDSPASLGCLSLLGEGAGIVLGPANVLKAAGLLPAPVGREAHVLGVLGFGASEREIAERTGLAPSVVRAVLDALECGAGVIRLPGGRYRPP
ncbi:MAG: DNA-processing protein DprA [Myxococcota bacterium]